MRRFVSLAPVLFLHEAFWAKFEREIDPGGLSDPAERARPAEETRKAYLMRLALMSARARAKKAARRQDSGTK